MQESFYQGSKDVFLAKVRADFDSTEDQAVRATIKLHHRLECIAKDFLAMIRKASERHDDDLADAFLERKRKIEGLLEDLEGTPVVGRYSGYVQSGSDLRVDLRR